MPNLEHQRRLDLIMRTTTNMVVVTNRRREIEWVNPAYTRVTGWALHEVRGRRPREFLHGPLTDAQALRELSARVQRGEPVQDFELLNYAKSGRPYWVSMTIHPVLDSDGQVTEYVSVQTDVTARKQREMETARAHRRLQQAQRIAGLGVIEYNLATGSLVCSPEVAALLEAGPAQVPADLDALLARCHPEDRELVRQRGRTTLLSGEPFECEARVLTQVGRLRWVLVRGALESRDDGVPLLCRLVVQDVTDRRQAEQLRLENARLEQLAAGRADMLARVAHELRTPLHAALGFAQLLQDSDGAGLSDAGRTHLHHIRQATQHLLATVNDMLDLARLHDGQEAPPALQGLDVAAVLGEVAALLAPVARQGGVSLSVHPPPAGDSRVMAHPQRLLQVLINLVGNAVKYTGVGGQVTLRCEAAGVQRLALAVSDTGPGIAAEHLPRLFEPFYRAAAPAQPPEPPCVEAEAPVRDSSGLGLPIARSLARSMGGDITVASRPGEGSTFRVWLRAASADPVPAPGAAPATRPTPAPAPEAPTGAVGEAARGCVLLVEDEPLNQLLVQAYLRERPALALEVRGSGAAGLEAARTLRPALVLLDMGLPDMHGSAVLRAMREDPALRCTPCIAFSADADPRVQAQVRALGCSAWLPKPAEREEFLRVLDAVLQARRCGEPAAR